MKYISVVFRNWPKSNIIENNNPNKIIIATGDTKQLPPIAPLSNQHEYSSYADHCIDSVFAHEVVLKHNKRLKSAADKIKLKKLKEDIFNKAIPDLDTIKKFGFKGTSDITKSLKNIAYVSDTCTEVSKQVRKKLGRKLEYEKGEHLICREYFKNKGAHIQC